MFHTPEIPGNTGNTIRLAAITGSEIHLIKPLGFDLDNTKLKRAGLDYHDLTTLHVHENLTEAWKKLPNNRVFAFTTDANKNFNEISYQPNDILLFGPESTGLNTKTKQDPRITEKLKIPMLPGVRSLNLANCAAIAIYEAWRQHNYKNPKNNN